MSRRKRNIKGNIKGDGITEFFTESPIEFHLPGASFIGPGTKLIPRLNELSRYIETGVKPPDCKFKNCSMPTNLIDTIAMEHDIAYHEYKDLPDRHRADRRMLEQVDKVLKNPPTLRDRLDGLFVKAVLKAKLGFNI